MKNITYTVLLLTFILGCSKSNISTNNFISIDRERFVDSKGCEVILNGINHVTKNPETNFMNQDDSIIFTKFRDYGFNCIRYGLSWAMLEPQPGVYNQKYLEELDKRIKWAKSNNIRLILDMHQDLFSVKYGNGAPEWASLDNGLQHLTGEIWSDSYIISPAVQSCFDNFWNNKSVEDGLGVQDHYIQVWKTIAERYSECDAIIGYDIMNEPFPGSDGQMVFNSMIEGYVSYMNESEKNITSDINELWADERERIKLLKVLNNKDLFFKITEYAKPLVDKFEQGKLSAFYQKARDAIRSVDKNHILFLEHCYFGNMGIKSTFKVPVDEYGKTDNLCAYAPHAYDLVVDTEFSDVLESNRLEFIFDQIIKSSKERQIPIWLGEWGAFYDINKKYERPANFHKKIIETNLMGQAFWSWWDYIDKQDFFYSTLSRTYPVYINGRIIKYGNNEVGFECEWDEKSNDENSCIYLSNISGIGQIEIEPKSKYTIVPLNNNSIGGHIYIKSVGGKRFISIKYK